MAYDFDLGSHSRPITTNSPEAQAWFDRGLLWCFGFNHEEAVVCFQKATKADPNCALAYWGIAFASGPFYNMPWEWFSEQEAEEAVPTCYAAVQQALRRCGHVTLVEQALIQALAQRFPSNQVVSPEEFCRWEAAYAEAMRGVYAQYPEDLEVVAFCAEALMTLTPWKLWDVHKGEAAPEAHTKEIIAILEGGLALVEKRELPPHPALLHLHLHVWEMSPTPERALDSANTLFDVCPDAGHLQHMPAHIYAICGQYPEAIAVSEQAIATDNKYLDHAGPFNFYTTSRCHDFHMMMYAAMFAGQYQTALKAAEGMMATLTPELLAVEKPHMAVTMEGYYSTKMHVLVRFGRWQDIIDAPLPADPELYCVSTAMHHYAKGVAHSALGQIVEAEAELVRFEQARRRIPENRLFFNNQADDILAVGLEMLLGELEYRKGNFEVAFGHLRAAVELDDHLYYTEPWAWMHPPRHALAALLLEQDRTEEAEQVYRADLGLEDTLSRPSQHPDNVWSLHGYVECLRRTGKSEQAKAMQQRLNRALQDTDVTIAASCCCRTQV